MDPVESPAGSEGLTSWVSVCPKGLWRVRMKRTQRDGHQMPSVQDTSCSSRLSPRLGSLCQVQVRLKASVEKTKEQSSGFDEGNQQPSVPEITEDMVTPFPRRQDSVLQVPLGDWTTLRLGEGQCDITEACLEGMKAGEKCEIQLFPVEGGPDYPADPNWTLHATVELKTFTPGKESWEMPPGEKLEWVKSHKERGGGRFRSGDVWGAADSYTRALKLLIPLYGDIREVEKKGQVKEADEEGDTNTCEKTHHLPSDCLFASAHEYRTIKAELHSNLSLCQLKLNQPERAKASAAKATQLEPGGAKAWYRLGQACLTVNELEEAKRAFRKMLELQPDSTSALKALKYVANKEKETNAQLRLRLSKMFS